jgi:hypothetical protein
MPVLKKTCPTAVCHTVPDASWSLRQVRQTRATPALALGRERARPTKMIVEIIGTEEV